MSEFLAGLQPSLVLRGCLDWICCIQMIGFMSLLDYLSMILCVHRSIDWAGFSSAIGSYL